MREGNEGITFSSFKPAANKSKANGHIVNSMVETNPDEEYANMSNGGANGGVIYDVNDREMAVDCPADFTPSLQPKFDKNDAMRASDRLRVRQDELRQKQASDAQFQKDGAFLRASLRGSKKMQALKERPVVTGASGFENKAFEEDKRLSGGTDAAAVTQTIQYLEEKLSSEDPESVETLKGILTSERFLKLLAVHRAVNENARAGTPESLDTEALAAEIAKEYPSLTDILHQQHIQIPVNQLHKALLQAHDLLAQRRARSNEEHPATPSPASTPPTPARKDRIRADDSLLFKKSAQYGCENLKIIRLEKSTEMPLGATIKNEGDFVIVGRVVKGSIAYHDGNLHEGDELLELNGVEVRGKHINDVCDLLLAVEGAVEFLVSPNSDYRPELHQAFEQVLHLRALFNYEPMDDKLCPCRELGLGFQRGEVLHVISCDDANWWQAYRDGEADQMAGLVPSKEFWEQRELHKNKLDQELTPEKKKSPKICGGCRRRKKKAEEDLSGELVSYDVVCQYIPQPNRKRPIVLVGPPKVGRHEIRRRVMESDLDRFMAAVPHTSRPRNQDEEPGKDYFFVETSEFKEMIRTNKFIEYGKYEGHYYGTSLDSVKAVIAAGKTCLLNLAPECLSILRTAEFRPYIVFVGPPGLTQLKALHSKLNEIISDDECQKIIELGREMDSVHGHLFDYVIVNYDMDKTFSSVMAEVNRLEVEPQWIPVQWLQSQLSQLHFSTSSLQRYSSNASGQVYSQTIC